MVGLYRLDLRCIDQIYIDIKGSLRQESIPTKPRFRSVPDVAVLNSLFRLRNGSLSSDVFQRASFGIIPRLRQFSQIGYSQSASLLAHNLIAAIAAFPWESALPRKQGSPNPPLSPWRLRSGDFLDEVKKIKQNSHNLAEARKYSIRSPLEDVGT